MYALGKSAEEVGEMTLADALDLFAYWRKVPPVPEMLFAALGGGSKQQAPADTGITPNEQQLRAMADMLNGKR